MLALAGCPDGSRSRALTTLAYYCMARRFAINPTHPNKQHASINKSTHHRSTVLVASKGGSQRTWQNANKMTGSQSQHETILQALELHCTAVTQRFPVVYQHSLVPLWQPLQISKQGSWVVVLVG